MEARLIRRGARALAAMLLPAALVATAPAAPPPTRLAAAPAFDAAVAKVKADMLVDPEQAIVEANAAMALLRAEARPAQRALMRATIQWLQGEAYVRLGKPQRALDLLADARQAAEAADPRSQLDADILLAEGSALTDTGRITDALTTLQRAHELFRTLGQARSRAKALILIALLYDGARDHEAALRYFAQARDAYADDPGLLLAIYNGRGIALNALQRYAAAEAEFAKALPIARSMNSDAAIVLVLGNIADAKLRQGETADAARVLEQGIALARRPGAAAFRPQMTALAASVALKRGDLPAAARLIERRFAGVDLKTTILSDREAHDVAYRVFLALGEDDLALRHLTALKRLDDQATEIARSNSAALAAAQFDYANQELRIATLKADDLTKSVAFERATARTQRWIFVGASAATLAIIALLGIGLVTIRRSRNEVRAANDDLALSNVELEKALRAKTEFLATTSHEIRTPLNGILGMTQVMIADRGLDAATRERLSVVHGAGTTMRALVDDILDVAKIETGRMTIEAVPMDLHATIADATRMWREQATAKGLAFAACYDAAPRWIVGDAARLRQIVFNLLSNAVKFTEQGHVALAADAIDGRVRLTVADSGIGIAAEAHELIFESFRQAEAGTTRRFGGTGLGLSICRKLARAMDGDVTVESRSGAGAVFTLDLPIIAAAAPDEVPDETALLVVERNPIQRAMFRTLFGDLGAVAFADDAAEAAQVTARLRPARVLIETGSLGEGDGRATVAAIVAAAGEAPVSLLCAACDPAARVAWLSTGAAQVIERPIGKKALVSAVLAVSTALVTAAA